MVTTWLILVGEPLQWTDLWKLTTMEGGGDRDRDRTVVVYAFTYTIIAYHH